MPIARALQRRGGLGGEGMGRVSLGNGGPWVGGQGASRSPQRRRRPAQHAGYVLQDAVIRGAQVLLRGACDSLPVRLVDRHLETPEALRRWETMEEGYRCRGLLLLLLLLLLLVLVVLVVLVLWFVFVVAQTVASAIV